MRHCEKGKCVDVADYCINYNQSNKHLCDKHFKDIGLSKSAIKKLSPDYYYDSKSNKLVVNRIARVPHDKLTNLPTRYTRGLTSREKLRYSKDINKSREYYRKTGNVKGRSRVSKTLSTRRSKHTEEFIKRYGFSVAEHDKVKKLFPDTDVNEILSKGRAAYASGSRPNVSGRGGVEQWANARLASVLTGGKALAVDKDLVGPKSLKKIYG